MRDAFSQTYQEQLRAAYPAATVDQITGQWRSADLPEQPGETIPYVRVNQGASARPALFVPGFGEGIVNKAPFAAELAQHGVDLILPGQNRRSILRDASGHRQAAAAQARNLEAIIAAEGLENGPLDFVSHSYGSLVLESMVERASQRGSETLADSTAIMLAPAGLGDERLPWLGWRWLKMLRSESKKESQDFPDHTGETMRASALTLLSNVPRTVVEIKELVRHQIAVENLAARVGQLLIVSYAEDALFPDGFIYERASRAVEAGAAWLVPIDPAVRSDGSSRLGRGAVHDDEQFNPSRVAGAILPFLKPATV